MLSAIAIAGAVAASAAPSDQCRRIHYAQDGTVTESIVTESAGARNEVRTSAQGTSSASSSVSASSGSAGNSSSRSSSSVDGRQSSVSITRDKNGCTIVVDDRPPQGESK